MGTHVSGRYNYTVFIAVIRNSRFANELQKVKSAFASPFEAWKFQNRPSFAKLSSKRISAFQERVEYQPEDLEFYPVLFPARAICTINPSSQRLSQRSSPDNVTTSLSHLVSSRSHHAKSISTRWCSTPLERS